MAEDPLVHRWRAGERGDLLLSDAAHHGGWIEHDLRDDGRAHHEAAQDAGVQTERVEEGVDDQISVSLTQSHHVREDEVGATDGTVLKSGTLRRAGCAGCEQDVAYIVGTDRRSPD